MSATGFLSLSGVKGIARAPHEGWIELLSVSMGVTNPRDDATGQKSGKKTYPKVVVLKEWDDASPPIYQALTTNQSFKQAVIEFVRNDPGGKPITYYRSTFED